MSIEEFTMMDRRALMRRAMFLVGATAVVAGCSTDEEGEKFAFEKPQFLLLSAVADTIIPKTDTPGAVEVGVPKLYEGLLRNWASPDRREEQVAVLEAIDGAAEKAHGKPFADLTPEERKSLLTGIDAKALQPPKTGEATQGKMTTAGPPVTDPGYSKMKELIAVLYYYSEPALTEELAYVHDPGRWDPSTPITEDTRPWGGLGLF